MVPTGASDGPLDEEELFANSQRALERARAEYEARRYDEVRKQLEELITPATFPEPKAANIHAIAVRVRDEFGGALPCDGAVMQEFTGVGPKCANLALGIACGQPTIPVDIHVHRVLNRWGYVRTRTPEQTLKALEPKLPMEYRPSINRLLLPFGKYICTGGTPRCLSCPLIDSARRSASQRLEHRARVCTPEGRASPCIALPERRACEHSGRPVSAGRCVPGRLTQDEAACLRRVCSRGRLN